MFHCIYYSGWNIRTCPHPVNLCVSRRLHSSASAVVSEVCSGVNQLLHLQLFCSLYLSPCETFCNYLEHEDVWNFRHSSAIHLMGPSRRWWNLIKHKSRASPNQIGSTSWIFENIWICLWECVLLFWTRAAAKAWLLTKDAKRKTDFQLRFQRVFLFMWVCSFSLGFGFCLCKIVLGLLSSFGICFGILSEFFITASHLSHED